MYVDFLSFFVSDCTTSQYTVKLNVKSDVDAYDGVHHVIAYENVSLTATAHPNANLTNKSFIFQYRYLGGDWNECLRVKSSRPATVVSKWKDSGVVECVVLLVTQGDRILGCANASIQIAGYLISILHFLIQNTVIIFTNYE